MNFDKRERDMNMSVNMLKNSINEIEWLEQEQKLLVDRISLLESVVFFSDIHYYLEFQSYDELDILLECDYVRLNR